MYAVAAGRKTGIFSTWAECKESVDGYKGAKYKKFASEEEAQAFIDSWNCPTEILSPISIASSLPVDYYVYTDGACKNNGSVNAIAGIGVYFGEGDPRNVSRRVDGKQTNNLAELSAVIEAHSIIRDDIAMGKRIVVMTDSNYVITCMGSYGMRMDRDGWKKDIPNRDLVQKAYGLYKDSGVEFRYIAAHTGQTDDHSMGNEGADRLANLAIGETECPYAAKRVSVNKFSIENEMSEMKNDIRELKNTMKELVGMMNAMYEFEDA